MRERLVEAMARALYEQFAAADISCTYCSWELLGDKQSWRDRALPALDAALDVLETPPPEMVDAALWKHQLEGDKALHRGAAYATFTDMLATLRSPKI